MLRNATVLVVIFASALIPYASASSGDQSPATESMDRSIKPGDDFYRYANGSWLAKAVIPAGQQSYDNRAVLVERTSQRVRDLILAAAASHPVQGSVAQKVGDYYASFMDQDGIESKGMKPLADEMASISAIRTRASL